jgi:DNA-binding GntR family transcriptional regulator
MISKAQVPMYLSIVDDIKNKILANNLKPFEFIGTQIDTAKKYNTSEITSRRALKQLTEQGYVYMVNAS